MIQHVQMEREQHCLTEGFSQQERTQRPERKFTSQQTLKNSLYFRKKNTQLGQDYEACFSVTMATPKAVCVPCTVYWQQNVKKLQ